MSSDQQQTDPTCVYPTLQQRSSQVPRSLLHYMPGCHSHAYCPAGHPLPGERAGARLEKKMAQTQLEERGRLPLSFIEEDATRQQLRKEESNRHSLSCLGPNALVEQTPSMRRAVSSTALKQRQPGETHHHKELIQLKEDAATSWIFAVRGEVVRQRACDEVSEEFRRAGIGHCFRGLHSLPLF